MRQQRLRNAHYIMAAHDKSSMMTVRWQCHHDTFRQPPPPAPAARAPALLTRSPQQLHFMHRVVATNWPTMWRANHGAIEQPDSWSVPRSVTRPHCELQCEASRGTVLCTPVNLCEMLEP